MIFLEAETPLRHNNQHGITNNPGGTLQLSSHYYNEYDALLENIYFLIKHNINYDFFRTYMFSKKIY